MLLRRPLGIGGLLKRKYYATINLKDFGNARLLTQNKYPIRCTGKQTFYRGIISTAIYQQSNKDILSIRLAGLAGI